MKAKQFIQILRQMIREEVTIAVRTEMKILSENKVSQKPVQQTQQRPAYQPPKRTTPLVTFDDGDIIGSLLNETAANMGNGLPDSAETPNPDFATVSSNDTYQFVRDYSEVLKKSQGFSK
jgi:hypothetical protein